MQDELEQYGQDELEQYGQHECLGSIPITADEDTNAIVIKLASKIEVQVKEEDISVSDRLTNPQSNNTASSGTYMAPAIIVKFVRCEIRDKLYLARSMLKDHSTRDLGYTRYRDSKIYMAESLTNKCKELFKSCLKKKLDMDYRYF